MSYEKTTPMHSAMPLGHHSITRSVTALGVIIALLAACSDAAQTTAPAPAVALHKGEFDGPKSVPTRGRILVSAAVTGDFDVFTVNEDGTGLVRLTSSPGLDGFASYSPDRRKIAFLSDRDGAHQLYVMNADGSGVKQLTNLVQFSWTASAPSWSPDGKKLVFSGTAIGGPDASADLYVVGANGVGLTKLLSHAGTDGSPQFSPDGQRIAFSSDASGNIEVWTVDADGTDPTQLTQCVVEYCRTPAWSPDGTQMAISIGFGTEVRVVPVALPSFTIATIPSAEWPVWSPDGLKLAVTSTANGLKEAMIVNMNGSAPQVLSVFGQSVASPSSWAAR